MGTVEEFERHCAYCRQPIRLKWKNGLIPSEGVCLVTDQVFHDKCWDKYKEEIERRWIQEVSGEARPRPAAGALSQS
jgi:hypothetical protein